jgi:hypothetical protein
MKIGIDSKALHFEVAGVDAEEVAHEPRVKVVAQHNSPFYADAERRHIRAHAHARKRNLAPGGGGSYFVMIVASRSRFRRGWERGVGGC